jgi:predicted nucleotidyltransferase
MKVEETIKNKSLEIRQIAERHGASNIRLFGSVVRGEAKSESDVDFLIDVTAETSPWFPVGLIQDLEKLLGRRVEIVTERALNKDLREKVLREAVPV